MKVVKLLEKKEVIRVFGVGLWLAPLFNSFLTYLAVPASQVGASGFRAYWSILLAGTTAQHILDLSSLVIGTLLLMGARSAWKYMLALLGGYMILQLLNLGQNLRNNPLNGLFFLANVGLFLFIADQLAFKQKLPARKPAGAGARPTDRRSDLAEAETSSQKVDLNLAQSSSPKAELHLKISSLKETESPISKHQVVTPPISKPVSQVETKSEKPSTVLPMQQKPKPNPRPMPVRRSQAKIMVHFQNHGPWAQVIAISAKGIELRGYGKTPLQIEDREVELNLAPDLDLRARLKSRNGSHYFFEYTNLAPSRIQKLNQWLLAQAS